MNYVEIMKMLTYCIYDEQGKVKQDKLTKSLWDRVLKQFDFDADRIEYASIMGVVSFAVVSPQGQQAEQRTIELVSRLMARKKQL